MDKETALELLGISDPANTESAFRERIKRYHQDLIKDDGTISRLLTVAREVLIGSRPNSKAINQATTNDDQHTALTHEYNKVIQKDILPDILDILRSRGYLSGKWYELNVRVKSRSSLSEFEFTIYSGTSRNNILHTSATNTVTAAQTCRDFRDMYTSIHDTYMNLSKVRNQEIKIWPELLLLSFKITNTNGKVDTLDSINKKPKYKRIISRVF